MRSIASPILLLGSLLASTGLSHAGDRSASQFNVGSPATAGQVTPANSGRLVQPPAQAAPAPVAALPPPAEPAPKPRLKGRIAFAMARSRHSPGHAPEGLEPAKAGPGQALAVALRPAAEPVAPTPPARPAEAASAPRDAAKTPNIAATASAVQAAASAAGATQAVATFSPEGPRESAAPTLADLLAKQAEANGVPLNLARAVVRIESRGNSRAAHRGALGLMQIKPATARTVGFSGGSAGLFEPEINLRFGMKLLGQAFKASGGDLCKALVRYQTGHAVTRMNAANRAYCIRAKAVMAGA